MSDVVTTELNLRRAAKEKMKSDIKENSRNRKRTKPNNQSDLDCRASKPTVRKDVELETDSAILQRRQKQIDYGKNTVGYHKYQQQIPIDKRTKEDPKTPDKYVKYSRRSWDTLIKLWRKKLHEFDNTNDNNPQDFSEDNTNNITES